MKLKAQNEALMNFKKSFEAYYNDISGVRTIFKQERNIVTLTGIHMFSRGGMSYPVEECKKLIAEHISEQLLPFIEFDLVDNFAYDSKDFVGRLQIVQK